jgi:ribosome-binding factor A
MQGRKKKRIEEQLRREISSICLFELKDPRAGFISVTRVELADDQRSAKVYLTARGSEEEVTATLNTLERARGFVQALIGKRLPLRWTPVLTFREDKDVLNARRIDRLIDRARRQDLEMPDPN